MPTRVRPSSKCQHGITSTPAVVCRRCVLEALADPWAEYSDFKDWPALRGLASSGQLCRVERKMDDEH